MPNALKIDVDGTITWLTDQTSPAAHARVLFTTGSVVTLARFPEALGLNAEIGYIDDTIRLRETSPLVNVKAWLLYGRSPIAGPMIVATDSPHHPLTGNLDMLLSGTPRDVLDRFTADPASVPAILGRMAQMAFAEGMLLPAGWDAWEA